VGAVIVIPARYDSTRFPGKPLAVIAGHSLVKRVWSIAKAVPGVTGVFVATDDQRIAEHVAGFGGETIMTSPRCRNGSERVYEAAVGMEKTPDIVVNLQGDAVLTPPWVIESLIKAMVADKKCGMGTTAVKLSWEQCQEAFAVLDKGGRAGTMVVVDKRGRALYFSGAFIPNLRNRQMMSPPVHRHIGIYAYRFDTLAQYVALEQLRALENGIEIKVVIVDYKGRTHHSIDRPEHVPETEAIIAKEGELVPI
jgi:3-deoxy-manno-octulosonate cytidylyltransferase (CMP-KDO synthetase)